MRQPLIGITITQDTPANLAAIDRISVDYTQAIVKAGGAPVLLPTDFPVDELEDLRNRLDGILLSGGGDIDPIRYRGKQDNHLMMVSDQRDELEISLAKLAAKTNWPIFGICRGLQVMNVALHGTLYTHLPSQLNSKLDHNTPYDQGRDMIAHEVTIEAGTRLFEIIGKSKVRVNSFHHQATRLIAPGLKVTAHAIGDGLVEGLEFPDHRFFLGVQWHPECLRDYSEHQALFKAFVEAARSS